MTVLAEVAHANPYWDAVRDRIDPTGSLWKTPSVDGIGLYRDHSGKIDGVRWARESLRRHDFVGRYSSSHPAQPSGSATRHPGARTACATTATRETSASAASDRSAREATSNHREGIGPMSQPNQPGNLRVNRANILRRIGRVCFPSDDQPGLPAPQGTTFYDNRLDLKFDSREEAVAWAARYELMTHEHTYQPEWRDGPIATLSAWGTWEGVQIMVNGWSPTVAEEPDGSAPEDTDPDDLSAEHRTTITQLPGGPIEVRCSCGQWSGTAPSVEAAERDAAAHRRTASAPKTVFPSAPARPEPAGGDTVDVAALPPLVEPAPTRDPALDGHEASV